MKDDKPFSLIVSASAEMSLYSPTVDKFERKKTNCALVSIVRSMRGWKPLCFCMRYKANVWTCCTSSENQKWKFTWDGMWN